MLVIAHRGANHEAIENSWSAFDAAIDGGAQRLEVDVKLTKDLVPVIMHDESLARTTSVPVNLKDIYFDDLKSIKLLNKEAIPTLEELLDRYLDKVEINLEIKGNIYDCAEASGKLVEKNPRKEKVIFSSFDHRPLAHLRDNHPNIKRACLWGGHLVGLRNLGNFAPQVMMERYKTDIIHPHSMLVTTGFMEQARYRGWTVYPWVSLKGPEDQYESRENLWTKLTTVAIDGLCTNFPRQFSQWVKEVEKDEKRFA